MDEQDKGWKGYGDWLGTGKVADHLKTYRPFGSARKFVRSLKLQTIKEWQEYARSDECPKDIPVVAHNTYKHQGWKSYKDWLGHDRLTNFELNFRPFQEARAFARSLGLSGEGKWREYIKSGQKPEDIPSNPDVVYNGHGWQNWPDWLGTSNKSRQPSFLPFKEARKLVHTLNYSGPKPYQKAFTDGLIPPGLPSNPASTYKDQGWVGWTDWLGNQNLEFLEARALARKLSIKSNREWRIAIRDGLIPKNIPSNPDRVYKTTGWISWPDWLGKE